MAENWRHVLYFVIGVLPPFFFGSRSLLQWIQSEREKKSVVGVLFWKLSICGNVLLALHYFIQFQYPFLFIQVVNAFIAWRNLNLLQKKKEPLSSLRAVSILISLLIVVNLLSSFQSFLSPIKTSFFSPPVGRMWSIKLDTHLLWHIFGLIGGVLFASRFWIQWIQAERKQQSFLGTYFWMMSLLGGVCCLFYFVHILDWISAAHHSLGMIPYLRNLSLIRAAKTSKFST